MVLFVAVITHPHTARINNQANMSEECQQTAVSYTWSVTVKDGKDAEWGLRRKTSLWLTPIALRRRAFGGKPKARAEPDVVYVLGDEG